MNEIIRVGIYTDDGNFPFKINKSKSLKENILDICKEANLVSAFLKLLNCKIWRQIF